MEKKKDAERLTSITTSGKYQRADGKELTETQKIEIAQRLKARDKKENLDFDPRKHRLAHGIRSFN